MTHFFHYINYTGTDRAAKNKDKKSGQIEQMGLLCTKGDYINWPSWLMIDCCTDDFYFISKSIAYCSGNLYRPPQQHSIIYYETWNPWSDHILFPKCKWNVNLRVSVLFGLLQLFINPLLSSKVKSILRRKTLVNVWLGNIYNVSAVNQEQSTGSLTS